MGKIYKNAYSVSSFLSINKDCNICYNVYITALIENCIDKNIINKIRKNYSGIVKSITYSKSKILVSTLGDHKIYVVIAVLKFSGDYCKKFIKIANDIGKILING